MWWIRFCDSRNKLGQAAEDMQQAYFESGNNKWNEYYHKMSSLWGQLSGVQYKESTKRCSKMKSRKIVKEAGKKVIPAANGCSIHDMGDCLIVTNKMGLNIGQCRTMIEAEVIADEADERTKERCLSAGHDREWEMYQKMSESSRSKHNMKKMKSRKIVKEADEGYGSDHPRIYVGTYAKYNDGSIDGKWIDISEYNTYEEFVDACRELHADEEDPEFMVQDYENFPERWYHEGGLPTEEEFNKINDYYLMDDNLKRPFEVYVDYTGNDSTDDFEEAYEGQFDSPEDFGYYCVENFGIPDSAENYIDYEAYGRDLTEYWHQGDEDETDAEGEPEDPEYYYDNDGYKVMPYDSDREVGEQYIDDMGGVEQMGRDELARYFDYDGWGRDLLVNDYWEDEGYVFRNI